MQSAAAFTLLWQPVCRIGWVLTGGFGAACAAFHAVAFATGDARSCPCLGVERIAGGVLATGLPPADMATIVADRLARLDRIVAEVDVQIHICPRSASPLDETAWSATLEPGDGGRRAGCTAMSCSYRVRRVEERSEDRNRRAR